MVNTTYNSTHDMIKKLQQLKVKTKLKFYQNISKFYDEMNIRKQSGTFQFEEGPFSKNVESIDKIHHEVMLLMKFLQTKPQNKKMNSKFHDLYYTVVKDRDDKEIVNENRNDKSYLNFNNSIIPNQDKRINLKKHF